jgi:hypothetical protein
LAGSEQFTSTKTSVYYKIHNPAFGILSEVDIHKIISIGDHLRAEKVFLYDPIYK